MRDCVIGIFVSLCLILSACVASLEYRLRDAEQRLDGVDAIISDIATTAGKSNRAIVERLDRVGAPDADEDALWCEWDYERRQEPNMFADLEFRVAQLETLNPVAELGYTGPSGCQFFVRRNDRWWEKPCDCHMATAIGYNSFPYVRCSDCGQDFKPVEEDVVREAFAIRKLNVGWSGSHSPGDWIPLRDEER